MQEIGKSVCDTPNTHYPNGDVNFPNREFVSIRAV